MTTRNATRRFSPPLPSRSNIAVAFASVAAGIAIGIAATTQPFQSWGGDNGGSGKSDASTALAPWFAPAPPTAAEAFQAAPVINDRASFLDYDLGADPATTNLAPGSGVTNDAVQPSSQERKLSPTGTNGFRDFDPDVTFGSAGLTNDASIAAARAEHDNAIAGVGIVPDVTFGSAGLANDATIAAARAEHDNAIAGVGIVPDPGTAQPSSQERRLSSTGRTGFVDFDPAVRYTSD